MTENGRLSPAQKRALAAMLTERDVRSAAKAAGVAERTLFTWLKDPDFTQALRQAEAALIDEATRGLVGMQGKALQGIADVFTLASEQERVNIADFISEEPKAITIGRGEQKQTYYIESGNLNWEKIRERGHLIKRISFNQYGPILELYDAQAASALKLRAAQSVLDYLLRYRELNDLEERVAALEATNHEKHT
jgi:hypothetical protein